LNVLSGHLFINYFPFVWKKHFFMDNYIVVIYMYFRAIDVLNFFSLLLVS
jgi:hypothetical protein